MAAGPGPGYYEIFSGLSNWYNKHVFLNHKILTINLVSHQHIFILLLFKNMSETELGSEHSKLFMKKSLPFVSGPTCQHVFTLLFV